MTTFLARGQQLCCGVCESGNENLRSQSFCGVSSPDVNPWHTRILLVYTRIDPVTTRLNGGTGETKRRSNGRMEGRETLNGGTGEMVLPSTRPVRNTQRPTDRASA